MCNKWMSQLREDALDNTNSGPFFNKFISLSATSFWWSKLKRYLAKEKDVEDWREAFESGKFPLYFSDFLFHKDGAQEREKSFKFDGELECGEAAPRIKVQMA